MVHPWEIATGFDPEGERGNAHVQEYVSWCGDPRQPSPERRENHWWTAEEVLEDPELDWDLGLEYLKFRDPEKFIAGQVGHYCRHGHKCWTEIQNRVSSYGGFSRRGLILQSFSPIKREL